IPTLEINDKIFVNKYIYGLRIPFTFVKFFEWNEPKRGEVIVFIYPQDFQKDYIKRVVGLPGDTIEMKQGQLYINGKMITRQQQPGPCEFWDKRADDGWESMRCEGFIEDLQGHEHQMIL